MIINGFIKSQDLEISAPLIVSDTMNFLEFRFYFQTKEWDGLVKWAHFKQFNLSYDIPLQGDSITAAQGLSLPPGPWKLYIHGSEYVDGEVIQRITTDETSFMVERSGCGQGGPLPIVPASVGEQLEARIAKLEQGGGGSSMGQLVPIDGTLHVHPNPEGFTEISVNIAKRADNALVAVEGGLFVPAAKEYKAGQGIEIVNEQISVKLADTTHGLVAVNGALQLNLATKDFDGAMSKEDKRKLDAIPLDLFTREYEISHKPNGTLVDYRDKEIRILCPKDTEWFAQDKDPNMYYLGMKAYAPEGAVSFKEDMAEIIADNTMHDFNGDTAGTDEFGRNYSIVWLAAARLVDGAWQYFGAISTKTKYVGWYYSVEWYDNNGKVISADTIRINLSNEDCYTNINDFLGEENDFAAEIEAVQEQVDAFEEAYTWDKF